ncbi:MAG: tRNA 2-selenouridine(34) synthase MnmH, partial [Oceanicoccus sp.]
MSSELVVPADFRELLKTGGPLLDVRAEVEFVKGAMPNAFNVPILNTDERHQVGICYKQKGQEKAVELGHFLVSGKIRQQRLDAWSQFLKANPTASLYCWRGGMRSNLTQQWMRAEGLDIALIAGGYKALRKVILAELEGVSVSSIVVIGGKTGTAKTPLINSLGTGIDLEGFAHHRGSSFGRRVHEPPCQANFENCLAVDIMRKTDFLPEKYLFFEDESRAVGPLSVPFQLWQSMSEAKIAVVDMPLEFRVQRVLQEYVIEMLQEHISADRDNGPENYQKQLLASLFRIRKRLGSEQYTKLESIMDAAIKEQLANGDTSMHHGWIAVLLTDYYDPMYEYQLSAKKDRVVFSGDYQQVLEWAAE